MKTMRYLFAFLIFVLVKKFKRDKKAPKEMASVFLLVVIAGTALGMPLQVSAQPGEYFENNYIETTL